MKRFALKFIILSTLVISSSAHAIQFPVDCYWWYCRMHQTDELFCKWVGFGSKAVLSSQQKDAAEAIANSSVSQVQTLLSKQNRGAPVCSESIKNNIKPAAFRTLQEIKTRSSK